MVAVPYSSVPGIAPSTNAGNDYQNVQANPNDFGAQVGGAVAGLGERVQGAGNVLAQAADMFQDTSNQNMARDASSAALGQMSEASAAFRQLGGKDAVAGQADFVAKINSIKQSALDTMPNPMAKQMLAQSVQYMSDRMLMSSADHVAQQAKVWHLQSLQSQNEVLAGTALQSNDPNFLASAVTTAAANGQQMAAQRGFDEATQTAEGQKAVSAILVPKIAAMATTDPIGARNLLNTYADKMDVGTVARLDESLAPKVNAKLGQDAGDRALLTAGVGGAGSKVGFEAIKQVESNNRQFNADGSTVVSSAGAIGISQIMPDTAKQAADLAGVPYDENKLRTDAAYNETLGKVWFNHLMQQYGGDFTLAAAAYNAGEDRVDGWVKRFGDPRTAEISDAAFAAKIPIDETRNYVAKTTALNGTGAASVNATAPDFEHATQLAINGTEGQDPAVREAALRRVAQAQSAWTMNTQADRASLANKLPDLKEALLHGADVPIPTDDINRLLPPEKAAPILHDLNIAKVSGGVLASVQWSSPEQVAAARQQLVTGLGPMAEMVKGRLGQAGGTGPDSADDYTQRMQVLGQFDQEIARRKTALASDPAQYVQANPVVAPAAAAVDPKNPQTYQDYATKTLAVQTQLGVPVGQQHVLTAASAQQITHNLMTVDPSKGDAGAAMDGLAQQYGASWPKVFGDLVTLGRLPRDYQILASMPNGPARSDFQNALLTAAQKGGVTQLQAAIPSQDVKDIDNNIDVAIQPFVKSAMIPGGPNNADLVSNVRDSVKTLAYYYTLQGYSDPLQRATDAIINSKYDFSGAMRVPKGMLGKVEAATANALAHLSIVDLAPVAGNQNLTAEQRVGIVANAAIGRGQWVANHDDTGVVLIVPQRDGSYVRVMRKDGNPVEVSFKSAENFTPAPAPATPMVDPVTGLANIGAGELPLPVAPRDEPAPGQEHRAAAAATTQHSGQSFIAGHPAGLLSPGNLDLNSRPIVRNPDGSISTVRSITVTQDGKAFLIPTVVGNKVVSNEDAIKHWEKTGENLGTFDSEDHADAYAQALHEAQAAEYVRPAATASGKP